MENCEILELEKGFYRDGTADFYRQVVAPDAVFVIPGMGHLSRQECIDAAGDEAPWKSYAIDHLRRIDLGQDVIALTYYVVAERERGEAYKSWMTSLWRCFDGEWRLIFHQQTPES